MFSLSDKLAAALDSRERRLIRRRLPEPPSGILREVDFTSNDYLSLAASPVLRKAVLSALAVAPHILGSGGSRLLVPAPAHAELESRLCRFFGADAALLFNSGFDANVGFFSSVPQPGDVILYDAHIHASVHEGMRLSRLSPASLIPFSHNSISDLRLVLAKLLETREGMKKGKFSVFVAVESLYSMDGTIAPLTQIVECIEEMLPLGNGYVIVDEAHATGIYGPMGRGLVADLGLEKRVFVRLHTFGKALAASGAVLLTTELVKDYLLNYAKSVIYTTTLPFSNIIAAHCSFDMLEDGTTEALSTHLLDLSTYFVDLLRTELKKYPPSLVRLPEHLDPTSADSSTEGEPAPRPLARPWEFDPRDERTWHVHTLIKPAPAPPPADARPPLPTPIIPILTPEPRTLSAFLRAYAASCPFAPSIEIDASPSSAPSPSSSSSPIPPTPPRPSRPSTPRPTPIGPALATTLHTKPIFPPTVPAGTARVRICLHAGHTREDVSLLARGIVAWAEAKVAQQRRAEKRWWSKVRETGVGVWMEAKL